MSTDWKSTSVIRIVDDDEGFLKGLQFLLKCKHWKTRAYSSAEAFLAQDRLADPGCLLLDIRMPGMSGLKLQSEMLSRGITLPIVILTGHADLDVAVRTLKLGAVDFLQKPIKSEELDSVLQEALNRGRARSSGIDETAMCSVWSSLSQREQQIARLAAERLTSRQIGERLGLSERTVQGHRLNISKKFGIHSVNELAAMIAVINAQTKD